MSAITPLPASLDDIVFHVLDPLEAVERDIFLTRAEAWYPDLLDGLTTLYGAAAEEEAPAEHTAEQIVLKKKG